MLKYKKKIKTLLMCHFFVRQWGHVIWLHVVIVFFVTKIFSFCLVMNSSKLDIYLCW